METIAQRRREFELRRADDQARREVAHAEAEQTALRQWREALREGRSPYAERKGIERPESCRFTPGGWLLVPAIRYDLPREQSLKGLQAIRPDGAKRFTGGMAKAGAACRLGLAEVGEPVLLCEGWATGMTLRMATDRKVACYVAFDAGNLPQVAQTVHAAHPCSPLVLCADDDWRTLDKDGRPLNPGRVHAAAAREVVQTAGGVALLAMPVFKAGPRAEASTDFNDLHAAEGLGEVRAQMAVALQVAREVRRG
jgi:putative DNA primase/helicase